MQIAEVLPVIDSGTTAWMLTATALVLLMNLGLAGLLWVLLPVGANLLGEVFGDSETAANIQAANPIVQAWVVVKGATLYDGAGDAGYGRSIRYEDGSLRYDWPATHYGWLGTTGIMLANTLGYGLAALWLAWRAKRMFRRNVFDN